jgi:hypothetical protein
MIRSFIIKNSSVLSGTRIPNMEIEQTAQNLPVLSLQTLLILPTRLSPDLDGSAGANRAECASCQIAAKNDIEAICVWLAEYRDSPHTLRSYQKEVSRLLFWAIESRRKPLSSLTREDFLLFEAFLSDPDSRLSLIQQISSKPAGRAPRLSAQSRQQAIGILSNLFNYLVAQAGHHLTATAVCLITKEIFRRASIYRELADPAGAATLARASTHWIRHTAASHQANAGVDLRFVQENLRHASLQTTSIYLHAQDDQRHAQATGQEPASQVTPCLD